MCIEASKTLSVDDSFRSQLEEARAKLPPFQIGSHGQLQEWLEDFEDAIPNHRHTSHLVALYPEHQISPRTTPDLARAPRSRCNAALRRRTGSRASGAAPIWLSTMRAC